MPDLLDHLDSISSKPDLYSNKNCLTILIVSVWCKTRIQTNSGINQATMNIRSKTCMDHWNTSTIERNIMRSIVSCYILSIMLLVIQVQVVQVIEDLIARGLEKRRRQRDTRQKGSNSAQTKNHWNVTIQLNVGSWRGKMGSVIWKQSSTHQTRLIILGGDSIFSNPDPLKHIHSPQGMLSLIDPTGSYVMKRKDEEYYQQYIEKPVADMDYTWGDNEEMINSPTVPEAKLHKRQNILSFHYVGSMISRGYINLQHQASEWSFADNLTKNWTYQSSYYEMI